jgi:hypothetical protein
VIVILATQIHQVFPTADRTPTPGTVRDNSTESLDGIYDWVTASLGTADGYWRVAVEGEMQPRTKRVAIRRFQFRARDRDTILGIPPGSPKPRGIKLDRSSGARFPTRN